LVPFCFYRRFRLCITNASGKATPLRLHVSKGSLREGAGQPQCLRSKLATERSGVCRLTEGERVDVKSNQILKSRRLLPPLTRSPVSLRLGHARALTPHRGVIHYPRAASLPPGGRLSVSSIISQIGRENKFSADIYMCIRTGDLRSPAGEHSSPLPCSENILMRTLLNPTVFIFFFSRAPTKLRDRWGALRRARRPIARKGSRRSLFPRGSRGQAGRLP